MKTDRNTLLAGAQIIFGIIIFTSAWWIPEGNFPTGLYIFGFIEVLLGVATAILLGMKQN